ncbi:hypothetical protein PV10_06313, partial [Exophiala mesophila]
MSSPPQKVALYATNDLKNATDDAVAPFLTSLPKPYTFTQQHKTTNIRLALGYTAVAIAGALFYADYKLGWDATKPYTAPACIAYFLLNSALTYWIWAVEAGTIFVGTREGGQKLTIKSSAKKHSSIYKLKITYEAPSGKKWEDKEVSTSFTEWFSIQGYLQKKEFQAWLTKNIDVLKVAQSEGKLPSLTNADADTNTPAISDADIVTFGASAFSSGSDAATTTMAAAAGAPPPQSAKKSRSKKKP